MQTVKQLRLIAEPSQRVFSRSTAAWHRTSRTRFDDGATWAQNCGCCANVRGEENRDEASVPWHERLDGWSVPHAVRDGPRYVRDPGLEGARRRGACDHEHPRPRDGHRGAEGTAGPRPSP